MELVKSPAPAPSMDLMSATVGVMFVLQQTPRAVTVAPPSDEIVPPHSAVVSVIALSEAVVNTGTVLELTESSSPQQTNRKRTHAANATTRQIDI